MIAQQGVAEPTIFVWIVGNDHGDPCTLQDDENCVADPGDPTEGHYNATSPNPPGGAIALLPELQGHNVVVALAEDGTIADFSNRCGIAANWCIAAPGDGIIGAYFGILGTGVVRGLRGTSVAGPLVTGGLALMKQLFRGQLSHRELVTRLFQTADKGGRYATAATYGQGALDLGAAVSPVGTPRVTTGNRVADAGQSVQATRLRLGSALG
ncbi:MAG: S8 family serine peptidase, partial [Truepera sp.]|nr:S8 family serine peptidase [Truepera sp.]